MIYETQLTIGFFYVFVDFLLLNLNALHIVCLVRYKKYFKVLFLKWYRQSSNVLRSTIELCYKKSLCLFKRELNWLNEKIIFLELFSSTLNNIDCKVLGSTDSFFITNLLIWFVWYKKNMLIINATIGYILSTERFKEPLF